MNQNVTTSGQSRVWLIEGGVGPFTDPLYEGYMKSGDPSWPQGDITSIQIPDPNEFGKFVEAGETRGTQERVAIPLSGRYPPVVQSDLLRMTRKGCRVDLQVHIGACRRGANPQDYQAGWGKIQVYPNARITSYAIENNGALDGGENNVSNENVDMSAKEMYEIVAMTFGQQASAQTTRAIRTIAVCDSLNCGECGESSDGCQSIFAVMAGTPATPGTDPTVVYSADGGANWDSLAVDTLYGNETVNDSGCVGVYFVVLSETSNSYHYAASADILAGAATWVEVETGFTATNAPTAMDVYDPRHIWFVGLNGYIYFTSNIAVGVSTQDAGVATTDNLLDVDAYDANNVVAVGASNAVVYTANGGDTWNAVVGPAVGVQLNAVVMLSAATWLVGTEGGELWATRDSGQNWTEINLPTTVTAVTAIKFVGDTVGYLAADVGANGTILRTTDGGRDWYVLPESGIALPASDYINQLAVCEGSHNIVFAGGLADNGTAGIIIKGAGA